MILREPTRKGDKVKVTFVLPDDDEPGDVFVAGDFNLWNPGATMLKRRGQIRSASLMLSTGRRYAFRYYRDGRWFNDDGADGFEPNEYGHKICILDLTEAETEPTALTRGVKQHVQRGPRRSTRARARPASGGRPRPG